MKKKMLIAAAVAAMTASGGAWAACTADIDMGDNKIQNLGSPIADSDAATKAYVDAVGRLEISPVSNRKVNGFRGAVAFCQDMDDSGAVDGTASYAGWRLPQNLGEASLGFNRQGTTINIVGRSYAAASSTDDPVSESAIWVAMPATNGNQPSNTNYWNVDNTRWLRAKLDGSLWGFDRAASDGLFAFCVR